MGRIASKISPVCGNMTGVSGSGAGATVWSITLVGSPPAGWLEDEGKFGVGGIGVVTVKDGCLMGFFRFPELLLS